MDEEESLTVCRLCAGPANDGALDLFGSCEESQTLLQRCQQCLPVLVSGDKGLQRPVPYCRTAYSFAATLSRSSLAIRKSFLLNLF